MFVHMKIQISEQQFEIQQQQPKMLTRKKLSFLNSILVNREINKKWKMYIRCTKRVIRKFDIPTFAEKTFL